MDRRTLLRTGAAALAAGLAGCGGGDATDTSPGTETSPGTATSAETATGSPEPTAEPSPTATAEPTETATAEPSPTATTTAESSPDPTATGTATATPRQAAQTVEVAPDGQLAFGPESFEIAAGETVVWVWRAGSHNVRPSAMPDGAEWSGTAGGDGETYGESHTHSHTFEVAGEYEYYCAPHRGLDMVGSFTVTE